VTVAIANYNGRELLQGALQSLDAQTFRDFGVLVVDDGSTDDSVAWLAVQPAPDVRADRAGQSPGSPQSLNVCLSGSADGAGDAG
jgi:glycosyltransferase involved in cell wall biosynthesis